MSIFKQFSMGMRLAVLSGTTVLVVAGIALAHGDVLPQAVDTTALPDVGTEWLTENPYRADKAGADVWKTAVRIGSSGFNQNCARCHGLGAISGGLAPDLRLLEASADGDEWFVDRFQHGYAQDGVTKMPAFGEVLGQKAGWAIRTYIETRPEDGALTSHVDRLKAIRDQLAKGEGDAAALSKELAEIASSVKTASGAPVADSVASEAAELLAGPKPELVEISEVLTVGLSAAK